MKAILISKETLENMLMSAWVDGWYQKETSTDDGKRKYIKDVLKKLAFHEVN